MISTRLRLFREAGFCGVRDAIDGTNFTLPALFLIAKMQRNPKRAKNRCSKNLS